MATSAAAERSSASWKRSRKQRGRPAPNFEQQPPAAGAPAGTPPATPAPAQGRGGAQPAQAPPAPPSALALKYPWPAKPTLLGTRVMRLDAPDKVTGRAKYTQDISRPGMLYGKIVRSPLPHARIVSIDLSEALKAPGVKVAYNVKEPGAQV